MSNQVTIKLDSRIFYVLISILAVLGIFAIGWYLGRELTSPQAAAPVAQTAPQAGVTVATVDPAALAAQQGAQPGVTVQPQVRGAKPVMVADVAVGANEARLALPELETTNYTYDFGEIPAAEVTERDFIVRNAGTTELVIEEATASCGCAAALVADSTIAPGEETTVRVSYDPRVNREAGRFITKQVRIKSNDPLVPLAEFTITADVAAQ